MDFEKTINEQLKKATLGGDKIRMETLRSLRAQIIEFNKSGAGRDMNEDDALKILKSAAKKRRDAITMYEKGNRQDLVDKEKAELAIIEEFLPEQMGVDEIRKFVSGKISEIGAEGMKDMGKVMGIAMKELKGKADGGAVKDIVKELLSQD